MVDFYGQVLHGREACFAARRLPLMKVSFDLPGDLLLLIFVSVLIFCLNC